MRYLKKLFAACVLTLALALPAFAGDMLAGVTSQPPSPPQATAQGDMSAGVAGDMGAGGKATDPATEVWLSLLQSLLSLF
jgi:hypothetical protein